MTKNEALMNRLQELFEYQDGSLFWRKSRKNWIKPGQAAGSPSSNGYINVRVDGRMMKAHRVIYAYHHGYYPEFVDHINGVRTDNRIENLRPCTRTQNGQNQKGRTEKRNTFVKKGRYGVSLKVNGKQIHIGYFGSQAEASTAAEQARQKYFGEFA